MKRIQSLLLAGVLACSVFADEAQDPQIVFDVRGCANASGSSEPSLRSAGVSDILNESKIEVTDEGVRYFRKAAHQCCRSVVIQHEIRDRRIILTEWWTGRGCRCMCSSTIEALITHLSPGAYDVEVVSGGIAAGSDAALEFVPVISKRVRVEEERAKAAQPGATDNLGDA